MTPKAYVGSIPLFILIFFHATLSLAASFSAEMTTTRRGETQSHPFHLRDHQYRLDIADKGRTLRVLVDDKAGKTRVLVLAEKVYLEMDNRDMKSVMSNPFAAYRRMVQDYDVRPAGFETIDGMACEKQVISVQGKETMTAWVATDYRFPIKLENKLNGSLVTLQNIKPGKAAPGLFAIPAGFKRVERMPVPPPDWAKDIPAAPEMTPPFAKMLSTGQMIRVKPRSGFTVKVTARSPDKRKCAFASVPFKDGRPLVKPSMATFNLSHGAMTNTHKEAPSAADVIVVRGVRGQVEVEVTYEEAVSAAGVANAAPLASVSAKPRAAQTGDTRRTVLILDASGSMWGQINGKAKIGIAKTAMAELVDELPSNLHVGLTVYGHRRKGDCKDIEMVTPVQPLNAKALKAKIKNINPKGKTPLAASLLQVADGLRAHAGEKTIILITDGLESCGQDPCKVARELAASGAVNKIHIVGFDLEGDALAKLKCIADPSNGLLVGAFSAEELKSALTDVVTATLPHNLVVKGLDANQKPLFVTAQVLQAGRKVAGSSGSILRYSLPADSYTVAVRYPRLDQTIVLENVDITEHQLTEKEVIFAESKLKIVSLDGNNKALYSSAAVYRTGTDKPLKKSNGSSHDFSLAPGIYDVKVTHGPTKTDQWLRSLETSAGEPIVKEVVFAKSELKVKSLDCNNKALYSAAAVYKAGSSNELKRHTGSKHVFTLLPGVYDVKVTCSKINEDKWLRDISLKANEQIEQKVVFALGQIKITGFGPDGKKLYLGVSVHHPESGDEIRRATGGSPSFTLKPGIYDINVRAGKIKTEKWLRGVVIEDGTKIQNKVQF